MKCDKCGSTEGTWDLRKYSIDELHGSYSFAKELIEILQKQLEQIAKEIEERRGIK